MAFLPRASSGLRASIPMIRQTRLMSGGEPGSGAGMGGGGGGSIRDAGGAFGKMEFAHEEQYFRKLQNEQLAKLRKHLDEEVSHHEHEISRHQEAINRHKGRIDKLHEQQKQQKPE